MEEYLQDISQVDIESLALPISLEQANWEIEQLKRQVRRQEIHNRKLTSTHRDHLHQLKRDYLYDFQDYQHDSELRWEQLRSENRETRAQVTDLQEKSRKVTELSQECSLLAIDLAKIECEDSMYKNLLDIFDKSITPEVKDAIMIKSHDVQGRRYKLKGRLEKKQSVLQLTTKRLTDQVDTLQSIPDEGVEMDDELDTDDDDDE